MTSLLQRSAGAIQLVFVVAVVGSAILLSASLKPDSSTVRPRATTDVLPVTVVRSCFASFSSCIVIIFPYFQMSSSDNGLSFQDRLDLNAYVIEMTAFSVGSVFNLIAFITLIVSGLAKKSYGMFFLVLT